MSNGSQMTRRQVQDDVRQLNDTELTVSSGPGPAALPEPRRGLAREVGGSRLDPLTGLPQRAAFLAEVARLPGKRSAWAALLLIDIDDLERVNACFGSDCGDMVIRFTAEQLSTVVRSQDSICRFDGGQFLALLSGTDPVRARAVAERLRHAVQKLDLYGEDGRTIAATVSIGIDVVRAGALSVPGNLELALQVAAVRLRDAKEAGRNRVVGPRRTYG